MATAENLRKSLADTEVSLRKSQSSNRAIRLAMESELSRIDSRLMSIPSGQVAANDARAFEYRRLIEDRARLMRLLASGS